MTWHFVIYYSIVSLGFDADNIAYISYNDLHSTKFSVSHGEIWYSGKQMKLSQKIPQRVPGWTVYDLGGTTYQVRLRIA